MDEFVPYDPDEARRLGELLNEQCRRARAAKFYIYRDVFDWFGPAMLVVGFPMLSTDPPGDLAQQRALWNRADQHWRQGTALPILDTADLGGRSWMILRDTMRADGCRVPPWDVGNLGPFCEAAIRWTIRAIRDTQRHADKTKFAEPAGQTSNSGDFEAQWTGPTSANERRAIWLATAMLLVRDHPGWSDAEIARRVGKNKSTLSRSKEYQAAATMARGAKEDRRRGHRTVDLETGQRDVEAYSDERMQHTELGQAIRLTRRDEVP